MNISASSFKKLLLTLCAVALGSVAANSAHAQILLYVDFSNNGAVTVTANTSGLSGMSVDPFNSGDGIELQGFFTANSGNAIFPVSSGALVVASTGAPAFDTTAVDADHSGMTVHQTGLDLFENAGSGLLSFTSGQQAFSGTTTLNLSLYATTLPTSLTAGSPTQGNIIAGFGEGGPQVVIGQWQAVQAPEPSTWMMVAAALLLLTLVRRFRRA